MIGHTIEPTQVPRDNIELEEQAIALASSANRLSACLPKAVQYGIGELVRSMNCYYSNLIEGHPTLPREIDDALKFRYSDEPDRRDLQLEAVAHIQVQKMIDLDEDPEVSPTSVEYIQWLHYEFCSRLPADMLVLRHPKSAEEVQIVPGEFRLSDVEVGRHLPPNFNDVENLMKYFAQAYDIQNHRGLALTYSLPASHHRLLWIHPFVDGNGRVARLMSHALLKRLGLGTPLWSVSRGLARSVEEYKRALAEADQPRQGDLDGRGNLSLSAMIKFCKYFLSTCIDQISFMESILDPSELGRRIRLYVRDEMDAGRLPNGSLEIIMEAFNAGEVERGENQRIDWLSRKTSAPNII